MDFPRPPTLPSEPGGGLGWGSEYSGCPAVIHDQAGGVNNDPTLPTSLRHSGFLTVPLGWSRALGPGLGACQSLQHFLWLCGESFELGDPLFLPYICLQIQNAYMCQGLERHCITELGQ